MIWWFVRYFLSLVALAFGGTFLAVYHIMTASSITLIPLGVYSTFVFVVLVSNTKSAAVCLFMPFVLNGIHRIEGKQELLLELPEWWIPWCLGWLIISLFLPEYF